MDLTDEQKQQVSQWVAAGEGLAEIQRKLESEFGAQMTYMEVRFLVDDLELDLVDKNAPKADLDATANDKPAVDAEASLVDDGPSGSGQVKVEVDPVQRPGAMVSGTVTFSDGESMGWQVDQMGQLGLIPGPTPGYRPSEDDIMEFQTALEVELRKKGM
ncbi:hypothetical protein [Cerasicoccus fimbriatus]|uniref:hypothetical protein n=1 Tax=Cerasicoccus fimbriatus TaxID=3014554 RepID=UPI0022B52853|nr:hypothetical protein [Cerasicoccus sp. TK19100]